MSRRVRRVLITTFGILAIAVGMAALAWACTPSAYISVGPGSGLAGSSVSVTGNGFVPGPVDIRWNGTSLATATGPSFSVNVKIPAASPGVYYIRATATSEGVVAGQASRAFRVTSAPAAVAPQSPASPAPASSTTTSGRVKPAASQRDRVASRSGGAPQRTASKAGQRSPIVTTSSGVPVFEDSVAPASTRPSVARSGTGDPNGGAVRRPDRSPSTQSASSDLWSGFSANPQQGATLQSVSGPTTSPGAALIPGAALLALGGLALMSGLGAAAASRRRRRAAGR